MDYKVIFKVSFPYFKAVWKDERKYAIKDLMDNLGFVSDLLLAFLRVSYALLIRKQRGIDRLVERYQWQSFSYRGCYCLVPL